MTGKEYTFSKMIKKETKINGSDLPMYKVYNGHQSTWYFRLKVIQGYLVAHKLEINAKGGHQYITTIPEVILDSDYEVTDEVEWYAAVALLLNELDNQI